MSQAKTHEPVMLEEVVGLFSTVPAGLVIDATAGTAGHAEALLTSRPDLRLLCLDRDGDAVRSSAERLSRFGDRATVLQARFDRLAEEATRAGAPPGTVSGVLFDLGVSSLQFDTPERGFSYRHDAPLDMRMDPSRGVDAATVANTWDEKRLSSLFAANGEGRYARRIARAVVSGRPVRTTAQLSAIVRSAIPSAARRSGGHPARRVFQALRVAVNEELETLETALPRAIGVLAARGRCVTLAYHSGEDRIVKAAFARAVSGGCTCPVGLPCTCGATPLGRLVFRGSRGPSQEERARNPRSQSARMRAFERSEARPERGIEPGERER